MAGVLATLKRIYTEDGAIVKHLSWLVLAAIGAILSMQSPSTSTSPAELMSLIGGSIVSMVYGLILTIYTFGYNCIIMHNRFEEETKSGTIPIMPEFDILPFKIFRRAIVLVIVWIIWAIVISLTSIVPIIGLIFCLIVMPFIGFVQVAYSKEFKTEGLFSMALIAKFMRLFWVDAIWWWFRMFILGLVIYGILIAICSMTGLLNIQSIMLTGQVPPSLNVLNAIIQYISVVLGFINAYGMADIFVKKWDNSSY